MPHVFGPFLSYSVLFGLIWLYSVHFGPFCTLWSYSVPFGSIRASSVQFGTFCTLLSNFVLFGLSQSNSVYSVHFGLIRSIQYWSVHFNPIQSTLVHFKPILSTLIHSVLFGPIRSILVQHSICSVQENFQKPWEHAIGHISHNNWS